MSKDDQWSFNTITYICKPGYSGDTCDVKDTFITVQTNDDPFITNVAKKISFGKDTTTWFMSFYCSIFFLHELMMNIILSFNKSMTVIYRIWKSKLKLLNNASRLINYLITVHLVFHYCVELNTIMVLVKNDFNWLVCDRWIATYQSSYLFVK